MITAKDVLVVTTSGLEGTKIQKYLKPVAAHVVAGTNVFSDLAASFTDFFGGRSGSYQRQLASLYNEAVERIKIAAAELGANCIVGLSIDMDEISGKGKAMFMVTAVGTAVVIDEQPKSNFKPLESLERVSTEKLIELQQKRKILAQAENQYWNITDDVWDFLTKNQVSEIFPALVRKLHANSGFYATTKHLIAGMM